MNKNIKLCEECCFCQETDSPDWRECLCTKKDMLVLKTDIGCEEVNNFKNIDKFMDYYGDMSIRKSCDNIIKYVERLENRIKRLQEENEELKEGVWEKEEVKHLKENYERMKEEYYRGFPISTEEWAKIEKFKEAHPQPSGVSGGGWKYTFVPTALGTSGKIQAMNGDVLEFQEIG